MDGARCEIRSCHWTVARGVAATAVAARSVRQRSELRQGRFERHQSRYDRETNDNLFKMNEIILFILFIIFIFLVSSLGAVQADCRKTLAALIGLNLLVVTRSFDCVTTNLYVFSGNQ